VQSQERLIDELRVKLEASKGSSPTANNDDRITELENKLRELENKSKAESEASATSTAHLRDELTIREGEIESLRKAVEMATNENVELRRLAENTEADRCQREESDEGVQALKERIIEAEGIIGNLKERIKGQEEELEQRRIGLQKVEARVTELSLANSKLEEAAAVAAEAHDRDLQRVALEKVAEIELKDEELRSTNEEIQRHEEEMKAIKAQLSHGLKVEKELLNTRAALQELRTIRDQQANELVSREKIIAAHAEEMSRLSKESLDLNKRIEDQDRSESELHVMYQQVKSEYGKQLEETEDLRGRAEEQRMALADAEAKLKESTQSVEDLRASLDGKEAEIADLKQAIGELTTGQAADAAVWFRSHMEREIAVLKARGKKIDLAKNDELDKLRLALEATHASEKAQMQASIVKLEEALTDLQTQYDATTDELHTLR
ncbi:liver stage antigen-1, putative, partial [Perkinsus marinus ATCC 50983]